MEFLRIKEVTKRFGGLIALNKVSFEVPSGSIIGLMGPNGAGKTTLLNCINGLYRIDEGEILFKGRPLHTSKPHEIARMGVGRTFQVPQVFHKLTVLENVLTTVLHLRENMEKMKEKALEILSYVGLKEFANHLGNELSGGQQKLLEMARALMSDPDLFLLDEPFAGVHPVIKKKLFDIIRDLHKEGKTFLVVSHDIASIYSLSERIIFMSNGKKVVEGKPIEIQNNREVVDAYLGE